MSLKWIGQRFNYILTRPKAEMVTIRDEGGKMPETYLFLFIICLMVGLTYVKTGPKTVISETAIWCLTALIATLSTWQLVPLFDGKASWAKALKVSVYSLFPLMLCITVSNLIGYKKIILPLGLIFALYVLYNGITIVFKIPHRKAIFAELIVLLISGLSNFIARALIP